MLMKSPEGMQAADALQQLASSVTLTPHEAGTYERTGVRRFEKIVRFATVDCVKAGWLVKNKGTWIVTEAGAQAYRKFTDPESFHREAYRLYRAWRATQPGKPKTRTKEILLPENEAEESEESATVTFEQAQEQAWGEIERYLQGMNPYDFQQLVADILQAMGYHVSWIAPPGKDGGIDIIAFTDPLGTRPPRIKVQVKRVGQKVNTDGLKAFVAMVKAGDLRHRSLSRPVLPSPPPPYPHLASTTPQSAPDWPRPATTFLAWPGRPRDGRGAGADRRVP